MARTVGSSGPKTLAAIREAGLKLIRLHGYEAMSLRQLAAEVGIQQGSLYNYFDTKQDLLFALVAGHMEDLLAALDEARADPDWPGDPVARLEAFTRFHVTYHLARADEVFISYSELRSLEPANYRRIVALRRRYEAALAAILEEGVAAERLDVPDCKVAAFAILGMLAGIPTWFRSRGRLRGNDITNFYVQMVLGATGAAAARAPRRAARAS